MKAFLRQTRISPKKVAVVAALVRGKPVNEALTMLKFTPKHSAPVLAKLIQSAVANAENNFKQDPEKLIISKLLVNEGMTLKRGRPISRGRWHPIKRRTSRVLVELSPAVVEKATKEKVSKVSKVDKVNKEARTEEKPKKEVKAESEKVIEKKKEPVTKVAPTSGPKVDKAEPGVEKKTDKAEPAGEAKTEAAEVGFKKTSIKKDS